ncbi:hypothetical protein PKB_2059 [Pseudomonas knackmussii B13]|uniref:Bro-N domain-containing protein n=1 Tax=Pseudomonas knackmussii (strain DSM 6978 / CCUG 54928 / LMG 23759 / B13) TaxID=1301098 RepID=A0A024HEW2_PSEKB|nr:hypothetical protein [Pseudomonas knackmussii]CDF83406.1 hypothetical protein PKB_2059 [Pseudomonas knackmussii B13]
MDDSPLPTPLYFFRHRRLLRAVLLDDQAWFVLDDLRRLMGHPCSERLASRLDEDQVCVRWLRREDGELIERVLVSESGAYAALILFNASDLCSLRRWISNEVVPELRSNAYEFGPRHKHLRWQRQVLHVLDWQGQFWVSLAELPRVLGDHPANAGRAGWREWARRLR